MVISPSLKHSCNRAKMLASFCISIAMTSAFFTTSWLKKGIPRSRMHLQASPRSPPVLYSSKSLVILSLASSTAQPVPPPQHRSIRSPEWRADNRARAIWTVWLPLLFGRSLLLISSKFSGINTSSITALARKRASSLGASTMSRAVSSADCKSIINPFLISSVENNSKLSEERSTDAISFSLFFLSIASVTSFLRKMGLYSGAESSSRLRISSGTSSERKYS